jgi:hypothetical protein
VRRVDAELVENAWDIAVVSVDEFDEQVFPPDLVMSAAYANAHRGRERVLAVIVELFQ